MNSGVEELSLSDSELLCCELVVFSEAIERASGQKDTGAGDGKPPRERLDLRGGFGGGARRYAGFDLLALQSAATPGAHSEVRGYVEKHRIDLIVTDALNDVALGREEMVAWRMRCGREFLGDMV